MTTDLLTADLRLALSPARFATDALGMELDDWQCRVLTSTARRSLLNVTRQGGKSTVAAALGLHTALYRPRSLTLLVSPSQRQSSELFRKLTELADRIEPRPALLEDNKLSLVVDGGGRVVSLPGNEATVRGFSAVTLVVEDEASRVSDDLYRALRPMLAVSNGRMLLLSTPFGRRGHFHQEWTDGGPEWERVAVPATACARISPEFLEAERASLGEYWYRQEYLNHFGETSDSVFDYDTVMSALSSDVRPLFGVIA